MIDVNSINENEWYDIPGHRNHQRNPRGEIRHKHKHNTLRPHIDKDGYQVLSLGNVDNVKVHKVICETFHGPAPEGKTQVNHRDVNRQNNHYTNLEWVTPSENIKWGVDHGFVDPMKGVRRAAEVNPKPVRVVETGQTFDSVKQCAEHFNVRATNISRVLSGKRKGQRFHGCHLEFIEKENIV